MSKKISPPVFDTYCRLVPGIAAYRLALRHQKLRRHVLTYTVGRWPSSSAVFQRLLRIAQRLVRLGGLRPLLNLLQVLRRRAIGR